jgi:ABC-2 type transport system ATP-binding protein
VIRVEDFHKAYGPTVAVDGLTFEVLPGQVLGLLGPNGAGKTTTLRALCGVIPPTRGRVSVAGHDLATHPVEAKQRLAFIPDDPRLFEALTVREHLEFVAAAYRVQDWNGPADRLLARFELLDRADTPAGELSRGMRQKLAICCGYLHGPAAILFDEPLTGLDPRGIRTMKDSVRECAAAGAAVIISSHLLALVEDLCTHLLVLHRGRRLFFGPVAEARGAVQELSADASLEDVFFKLTEEMSGRAGN